MSWWNKHASRLILRTDGLIDRCDVLQSIPTHSDKRLLGCSIPTCSGVKWALITGSLCFLLLQHTPTGLSTSLDVIITAHVQPALLLTSPKRECFCVDPELWVIRSETPHDQFQVSDVSLQLCAAVCEIFLGSCCCCQPAAPQKMNTLWKCQSVTPTRALLKRFQNKLRKWCLFSHQHPLLWNETSGLRLQTKSL